MNRIPNSCSTRFFSYPPRGKTSFCAKEKTTAQNRISTLMVTGHLLYYTGIFFTAVSLPFTFNSSSTISLFPHRLIIQGILLVSLGDLLYRRGRLKDLSFLAPIPLVNDSHNCWLNSFFQLLMETSALKESLRREYGLFSPFISAYETAQAYGRNRFGKSTQALREKIAQKYPGNFSASPHQEEDPTELLSLLQREIASSYSLTVKKRYQVTSAVPPIRDERVDRKGNTFSREENGGYILLDLSGRGVNNAEEALENFFCTEKPLAEGGWFRGEDGERHLYPVEKEEKYFSKPPKELFIQLKLFSHEKIFSWWGGELKMQARKITKMVLFPSRLTISGKHLSSTRDVSYSVRAFIVHLGEDTQTGHYMCYVRRGGIWYRCNDGQISRISDEEAQKEMNKGYLYYLTDSS